MCKDTEALAEIPGNKALNSYTIGPSLHVLLPSTLTIVNSAFHQSVVGKSSTGQLALVNAEGVYLCGCEITLRDHIWQVALRSYEMGFY